MYLRPYIGNAKEICGDVEQLKEKIMRVRVKTTIDEANF